MLDIRQGGGWMEKDQVDEDIIVRKER
jgi:hypothetical protein